MMLQSIRTRTVASWLIYPISWACLVIAYLAALRGYLSFQQAWGLLTIFLLVAYAVLERILPYEERWSMIWTSFKSDFKFILTNVLFLAGLNALLGIFTISLAVNRIGPAHDWPLWLQLVSCLLVFEGLNYAIHRAMHEAPGRAGRFLWRVHVAHHLPEKVYVLMHPVFHPINAIFVQAVAMTLPIWIAGYDQRIVTLFLMINSMHGLISHFNVDVRMGWANYIFVGTELHRYHHSADVTEAQNYGATLSVYDQLFGTFVYRPGQAPHTLGVSDPLVPSYGEYGKTLALPFRS